MMNPDDAAKRTLEICQKIHPLLRGIGPEIQGAVLAELTSLWLAGHHPDVRDEMWTMHQLAVWDLLQVNRKIVRGE
jgi:hypothetical protein